MSLTVVETAKVVRSMHWNASSLFKLFVGWASDNQLDHGDVAAYLSSTGRHLGEAAATLKSLMPDSVLLSDLATFAAPSEKATAAYKAAQGTTGVLQRLVLAQQLLAQVAESYELLQQHLSSHADAPLARSLTFLMLDITNDLREGERLWESLTTAVANQNSNALVNQTKLSLATNAFLNNLSWLNNSQ